MLGHLLVHYYLLLFELHDLGNRRRAFRDLVLIVIVIHNVIDLFNLLHQKHHLGLSLPDLQCIRSVLFIELNEGLLQLQNPLIGDMHLSHHILLLFFIGRSLITLTAIG